MNRYSKKIKIDDKRKEIYIPRLHDKNSKKVYFGFDVETIETFHTDVKEGQKFRLCCGELFVLHSDGLYDCIEKKDFFSIKEVHEYLNEILMQYFTVYLVAHNASFDCQAIRIIDYFNNNNFKCKILSPHRESFLIEFSKKHHRIIIIDSMNYFRTSLKSLAYDIGMKKLRMPKWEDSDSKWLVYCRNDVDIMVSALRKVSSYFKEFNFGDLKITKASFAFSVFRKYFWHSNLFTTINLKALELEYASYHGGMVLCYRIGIFASDNYYLLDVNSLYPSVMVNNMYSTRLRRHFEHSNLAQLKRMITNFGCIAVVKIKTEIPYFPKKSKNGLVFPIGEYYTTLATPELELGLKLGLITECRTLSVYYRSEVFTKFIKHFHALKDKYTKENNENFRYFSKILMNSLYGKFGQKIPQLKYTKQKSDRRFSTYDVIDSKTRKIQHMKVINYKIYEEIKNKVSIFSIPSIVADVTSYSRVKMNELIAQAERKNIFYMDTDSLLVNQAGYDNLKNQLVKNTLGKLDIERQGKRIRITNLKNYHIKGKSVLKGVPKSAIYMDNNFYSYSHFSTLLESFANTEDEEIIITKQKKEIKSKYKKGTVDKNGFVFPFRITNETFEDFIKNPIYDFDKN